MARSRRRRETLPQLQHKLERASQALITSARITIHIDRPWPKHSTVPDRPLLRVADILNRIAALRAELRD